jgi:hypothetical protein
VHQTYLVRHVANDSLLAPMVGRVISADHVIKATSGGSSDMSGVPLDNREGFQVRNMDSIFGVGL